MEAEPPRPDPAEPDRLDPSGVETGEQTVDGGHRIIWQADRAGEHVRRPAGQHTERCRGAGDAGGHLVQGAVAAEGDDRVETASGGVLGEADRMPAPVRLDEFHVVGAAQTTVHDDRVAGRHR